MAMNMKHIRDRREGNGLTLIPMAACCTRERSRGSHPGPVACMPTHYVFEHSADKAKHPGGIALFTPYHTCLHLRPLYNVKPDGCARAWAYS